MSRLIAACGFFIFDIDYENMRNNIVAGVSCYTHS